MSLRTSLEALGACLCMFLIPGCSALEPSYRAERAFYIPANSFEPQKFTQLPHSPDANKYIEGRCVEKRTTPWWHRYIVQWFIGSQENITDDCLYFSVNEATIPRVMCPDGSPADNCLTTTQRNQIIEFLMVISDYNCNVFVERAFGVFV